jgi:uncharacterized protein YydD (DUF2326 family)
MTISLHRKQYLISKFSDDKEISELKNLKHTIQDQIDLIMAKKCMARDIVRLQAHLLQLRSSQMVGNTDEIFNNNDIFGNVVVKKNYDKTESIELPITVDIDLEEIYSYNWCRGYRS